MQNLSNFLQYGGQDHEPVLWHNKLTLPHPNKWLQNICPTLEEARWNWLGSHASDRFVVLLGLVRPRGVVLIDFLFLRHENPPFWVWKGCKDYGENLSNENMVFGS